MRRSNVVSVGDQLAQLGVASLPHPSRPTGYDPAIIEGRRVMPAGSPRPRWMSPVTASLLVIGALLALMAGMPAESRAADPSAQRIRDAVQFRESFGLRSDRPYVRHSFRDPDFSATEWGVPLDAAEVADLQHRVEARSLMGDAIGYANGQADSGGLYIDQRNHGWPVFLFTGDLESHQAAIDALLPDSVPFTVRRVSHTWAELLAMKDAIESDVDGLAREGVRVVSLGPDSIANTLDVGVLADVQHARHVLERYGNGISVALDQPAQSDDGLPPTDAAPAPLPGGGASTWWSIIVLSSAGLGGALFVVTRRRRDAVDGPLEVGR
jgi:hypothetical protein